MKNTVEFINAKQLLARRDVRANLFTALYVTSRTDGEKGIRIEKNRNRKTRDLAAPANARCVPTTGRREGERIEGTKPQAR